MNRSELLKKLNALFADWEQNRRWGDIVLVFRDGVVNLLSENRVQKLSNHPHDKREYPHVKYER